MDVRSEEPATRTESATQEGRKPERSGVLTDTPGPSQPGSGSGGLVTDRDQAGSIPLRSLAAPVPPRPGSTAHGGASGSDAAQVTRHGLAAGPANCGCRPLGVYFAAIPRPSSLSRAAHVFIVKLGLLVVPGNPQTSDVYFWLCPEYDVPRVCGRARGGSVVVVSGEGMNPRASSRRSFRRLAFAVRRRTPKGHPGFLRGPRMRRLHRPGGEGTGGKAGSCRVSVSCRATSASLRPVVELTRTRNRKAWSASSE